MLTDVVIIGGGISGLYTALKCLNEGIRVIVLEQMERLGGRIRTIHQDGQMFEAGAGRFHENHTLLRNLISFFGLHETRTISKHTYQADPTFSEYTELKRVIDFVQKHNIPDTLLQQLSFMSLCESVLGVSMTKKVMQAFGYNAEFQLMNAFDALRMFQRDFKKGMSYFSCREGLSTLVDRMTAAIRREGGIIYTQTQVTNIKRLSNNNFKVSAKDASGKSRSYVSQCVVCAIPKSSLEEVKFFSQNQRNLMNTVVPVSLHRIYGTFPVSKQGGTWFSSVPRSTTNTHIRQFIPINKKQGVAMVSYSDTTDADYWKAYADRGTEALKKQLLKQLHVTFPDIDDIPEPQWLNSYYWPAGVHVWKPGVNSSSVIPQIQQILGPDSAFYIVGEAYAKNQAWIEGALETVESIFGSLVSHMFQQQGGSPQTSFDQYLHAKNYTLTRQDLKEIKTHYPDVLWVLLRDPEDRHLKLVDVSQWLRMHPGGNVFSHRKYQDITREFMSIPYHKDSNGLIKKEVIEKIRLYCKAVIL